MHSILSLCGRLNNRTELSVLGNFYSVVSLLRTWIRVRRNRQLAHVAMDGRKNEIQRANHVTEIHKPKTHFDLPSFTDSTPSPRLPM
jgi:hypothetical protein